MYSQYNSGLADNGDFERSMGWISPGPIGIEPNLPAAGTEASSKRFLNYWIPSWKMEWNISASACPATSAILLWIPGAVLNYFLYSPKILYLPLLSLFPKLLLLGILLSYWSRCACYIDVHLCRLFGLFQQLLSRNGVFCIPFSFSCFDFDIKTASISCIFGS
jgi:hypothetical protein